MTGSCKKDFLNKKDQESPNFLLKFTIKAVIKYKNYWCTISKNWLLQMQFMQWENGGHFLKTLLAKSWTQIMLWIFNTVIFFTGFFVKIQKGENCAKTGEFWAGCEARLKRNFWRKIPIKPHFLWGVKPIFRFLTLSCKTCFNKTLLLLSKNENLKCFVPKNLLKWVDNEVSSNGLKFS